MANIRGTKTQLRVNCPDAISGIDALEPVQSQYAASPRIVGLLVRKAALLDPGKDLMLWYDGIFNPYTAQGVGLDIWGRIVGIGRMLWMQSNEFFGFAFQNMENFDQAPFWIQSLSQGQMRLTDEAYRFLIFYKAAANIGRGDMASINALLNSLFEASHGPANCCVLEIAPMEIRAVFRFYLTAYEQALLEQYGLLNRPAGVGFSWWQHDPAETFGFAGQELQNFGHGVFSPFSYRELQSWKNGVEDVFGFAGQNLWNFDNGNFITTCMQQELMP